MKDHTKSLLTRIPENDILTPQEDLLYAQIGFSFDDTIRQLKKHITDNSYPKIILDVGCAGGDLVYALSQAFPTAIVMGVDPSQTMIDIAKEKHPQLQDNFLSGYFDENIPSDFVVCESVLHHIVDAQTNLFNLLAYKQKNNPNFGFFIKDLKRPYNEPTLQNMLNKFPDHLSNQVKKMYEDSLRAAYTIDEVQEMIKKSNLNGIVTSDDKYLYITDR